MSAEMEALRDALAQAVLTLKAADEAAADHDQTCEGCLNDQACDLGDWLDRAAAVRGELAAVLAGGSPEARRPPLVPGDLVRTDNGRMALVVGVDMVALVVKDGESSFGDFWPADRLTVLSAGEESER